MSRARADCSMLEPHRADLGKVSDSEIARRAKVPESRVRSFRERANIAPWRRPEEDGFRIRGVTDQEP